MKRYTDNDKYFDTPREGFLLSGIVGKPRRYTLLNVSFKTNYGTNTRTRVKNSKGRVLEKKLPYYFYFYPDLKSAVAGRDELIRNEAKISLIEASNKLDVAVYNIKNLSGTDDNLSKHAEIKRISTEVDKFKANL